MKPKMHLQKHHRAAGGLQGKGPYMDAAGSNALFESLKHSKRRSWMWGLRALMQGAGRFRRSANRVPHYHSLGDLDIHQVEGVPRAAVPTHWQEAHCFERCH